ncbi:MAG: hypothetical protein A2056_02385 [Deltaproteobacteria bacterium GWA2_42_85]|nr:MAG: hypothetical protein A2056_02385 [Deltaproteobacteria bacterium GWA2_42_85]
MASAMMKLPIKRKTMGSAKGANTSLAGAIPRRTLKIAPRIAVTGIGIASEIQKTRTRLRIAASLCACGERVGIGRK